MQIIGHSIVYKSEDEYASFPLLNRNKEGNLVIGFFTAPIPDHCGIFQWNVMVSKNEGESWQLTSDQGANEFYENIEAVSPRYLSDTFILNDGKSLIATGSYGFKVDQKTKKYRRSHQIMHFWQSKGQEKNLTYMLPDVEVILTFPRFLHVKREFELVDVILVPAYAIIKETGLSRAMVWRSENRGETFRLISMFPDGVNANEMAFVETKNGILAHIRSDSHPYLLESWSDDLGKTWSYPTTVVVQRREHSEWLVGGPPHLLRLKDRKKIVCSYGYRQFQPMGIRASISKDDGITWTGPCILREDGGYSSGLHKKGWFKKRPSPANDIGYPVSIQLDEGLILTAYYITCADGITHIATTKWKA